MTHHYWQTTLTLGVLVGVIPVGSSFIHVFAMPCPIDSIHPPWIWGTMYAAFFLVFFFLFFSPYVATILSATMAIPFQFTGIYLWRYLFISFAPRSSTYAMDT